MSQLMPPKPQPGLRSNWLPKLTEDERAQLEALEQLIADATEAARLTIIAQRQALHTLRISRQRIINRGIGRSRWDLIGRDEHMANRPNRLAAMKARRQPQGEPA